MLVPFFAVIGIACVVTLALAAWARWLGGRYGAPRFLRWLAWLFVAAGAFEVVGLVRGVTEMQSAFNGAVGAADRQRILANGIAETVYTTALGLVAGLLGVLVMLVLTYRFHWSAKTPKVEGQPPYR